MPLALTCFLTLLAACSTVGSLQATQFVPPERPAIAVGSVLLPAENHSAPVPFGAPLCRRCLRPAATSPNTSTACSAAWRTWVAQRHQTCTCCVLGFLGRCTACHQPTFACNIVGSLPEALESLRVARNSLAAIGFEPPIWEELLQAEAPSQLEEDPSRDLTRGWQRPASQAVDDFCHRAFVREIDAASAALLESQAGPHAAREKLLGVPVKLPAMAAGSLQDCCT